LTYAGKFAVLFGENIYKNTNLLVAEATFAVGRYQIEEPSFHPYTSKYDYWRWRFLHGQYRVRKYPGRRQHGVRAELANIAAESFFDSESSAQPSQELRNPQQEYLRCAEPATGDPPVVPVKFPGTANAGEELSHGGKSQRKRKPKMTSDNRARLRVAALIFVMVNAVVFGVGLVTVLTTPELSQHAFLWIPVVIVSSFVVAPLLAWLIAPMMMQRFIQARRIRWRDVWHSRAVTKTAHLSTAGGF
jgi:hypothetical protein